MVNDKIQSKETKWAAKEGGGRIQWEDVEGTGSSDMDPQDLPLETATFRGTWETHRGKGKKFTHLSSVYHKTASKPMALLAHNTRTYIQKTPKYFHKVVTSVTRAMLWTRLKCNP